MPAATRDPARSVPVPPGDAGAGARYRSTFNQVAVGIAHTTTDGRILEANQKLCEMLGYASAGLLGLTTRDLTYPDDRDRQDVQWRDLLAGTRSHFSVESRYLRKDGNVMWVSRSVTLARETPGGDPYLIQTIEDITERKRTEARLARLTRARHVMAECSHVLVHATDETDMLESMCRVVIESGGYKMAWVGFATGDPARPVQPAAHAGFGADAPMTGSTAWSPDGRYQGFMSQVIATGEPHIARNILRDPTHAGRLARALQRGFQSSIALPLKSEGHILGAIALYAREPDAFDADEIALLTELADDIAFGLSSLRARVEREQSEKRMREIERKALETFAQAAVGITRADLSGVLVEINQKFCDMLGYSREEILGKSVRELTHPDDYGQGERYRSDLARGGVTRPIACEKRLLRKDGTYVWVRRTLSAARDDEGRPQYVVAVIEDISERKGVEDAIARERALLRTVVDTLPDRIYVKDIHGRYLLENAANLKVHKIENHDDIVGKTVFDLFPHDVAQRLHAEDQAVIETGNLVVNREGSMTDPAGGLHWHLTTKVPLRDAQGKVFGLVGVNRDITERKQAEQALRKSEERYRDMFEASPLPMWVWDEETLDIVAVNQAAVDHYGYCRDEFQRMNVRDVWAPGEQSRYEEGIYDRASEHTLHLERKHRTKDGRMIDVEVTSRRLTFDGRKMWLTLINDVTERRLADERLMHLAHYDMLTNLPNRVLFYDRLRQALVQAKRNEWMVGVMFIDVDRFKNVNDTLGHLIGDTLLQQVSERLVRTVRMGDTVGRLGGDEFAIVLSRLSGVQDANLVAQKIMAAFDEPFRLKSSEVYVTVSIGITLYPDDSSDQDTLIKYADAAMYQAKEAGRNSLQFYTSEMNARALELLGMESSLRRAMEHNEFLLHYQPKTSVADGDIVALEALLRWRHPERGLVSPAAFIPVLEETGLIVAVGEWVLDTVCAQIKAWERAGIKTVPVAVNLSARQFTARDLGPAIKRVLEAHQLDPALIEFEITESLLMENTEAAVRTLNYLKELGVGLSIDDFGTGYSSLSYLQRFPLDALKIDRSFIRDVTASADDATITRAVITMAHSLGLKVIAEGVETESQLAFLAEYGCDEIQGEYFSRPLPPDECGNWLREQRRMRRPFQDVDSNSPIVLLVDDDDVALTLLKWSLAKDGYRILSAHNAREALELLARQHVDAVISDQHMPGIPGVEFLQRVKMLSPRTARLIISGHTDFQMMTEAINKGEVFRFLAKGMGEDRLRAEVREAIQSRARAAHESQPVVTGTMAK